MYVFLHTIWQYQIVVLQTKQPFEVVLNLLAIIFPWKNIKNKRNAYTHTHTHTQLLPFHKTEWGGDMENRLKRAYEFEDRTLALRKLFYFS